MEWQKIGLDVGVGGVAGLADQLDQNNDEKRATEYAVAKPGKSIPIYQQFGTWLNYAVPAAIVLGVGMGYVRGDMATRLATAGGQLAGRKLTHRFTKGPQSDNPSPAPYSNWTRINAANVAAAARAAATRTYEPNLTNAKAGAI